LLSSSSISLLTALAFSNIDKLKPPTIGSLVVVVVVDDDNDDDNVVVDVVVDGGGTGIIGPFYFNK
jgi:hypothetical protein